MSNVERSVPPPKILEFVLARLKPRIFRVELKVRQRQTRLVHVLPPQLGC